MDINYFMSDLLCQVKEIIRKLVLVIGEFKPLRGSLTEMGQKT